MNLKEFLVDLLLYLLISLENVFNLNFLARAVGITLIAASLLTGFLIPVQGNTYVLATNPQYGSSYYNRTPHIRSETFTFPEISAASYLVADLHSGKILYSEGLELPLAPASVTKLMTALISREIYSEDNLFIVPEECLTLEGRNLLLNPGEILSFEDLIHALIINSSNDTACILSRGLISNRDFVGRMNEKASAIGMQNTNFSNAIGFDSSDGSNVSTAYDLYLLALAARRDSYIRELYGKSSYTLTSGDFPRTVHSTNELLRDIPGTKGIKTGTTPQAGEVLVYEYEGEDLNILIVLMGSSERFEEIRSILDWVKRSYVKL